MRLARSCMVLTTLLGLGCGPTELRPIDCDIGDSSRFCPCDDEHFCGARASCIEGRCVEHGAATCIDGSCAAPWHGLADSDFGSQQIRGQSSSWGGGLFPNYQFGAAQPAVRFDESNPVVAGIGYVGFSQPTPTVARFDGSQWNPIGELGLGGWTWIGGTFGFVVDSTGRSMMAARVNPPSRDWVIEVRQFQGDAWQLVGAPLSDVGNVGSPSMALDALDQPVVAWSDASAGAAEIFIKRFDGSMWQEVDPGSASGGGISGTVGDSITPVVSIAGDQILVVWVDDTAGAFNVLARRFDGSIWQEVGTGSASGAGAISSGVGDATEPSLVLDASDQPIVAWTDDTVGRPAIYLRRFDGSAWLEHGAGSATGLGVSDSAGDASSPSLTLDNLNRAVIAWSDDGSGNREIYARRFDAGSWSELGNGSASAGGISQNSGDSTEPCLAAAADGRLAVVWTDNSSGSRFIYIKLFDGADWIDVGPSTPGSGSISDSAGASENPSLALDADDNPVVAWSDQSPGNAEIFVKRFSGESWLGVGDDVVDGRMSTNAGVSNWPSLALTQAGHPVVAWQDDTFGSYQIYVSRFDGVSWQQYGVSSASGGGVSEGTADAAGPALVLDASDNPIVAWVNSSSTVNYPHIYVKRFDGTDWVEVGAGSASGEGLTPGLEFAQPPWLALGPNGHPIVVWSQAVGSYYDVYVLRFNGTEWQPVGASSASGGGISNGHTLSFYPRVVVDRLGRPVVAWGAGQVRIMRYDGAQWNNLPLTQQDSQISDPYIAWLGALALDSADQPVVAWHGWDLASGRRSNDIFARKLERGVWADQAPRAGGISNSESPSLVPSLAIGSQRSCMAWQEGGPTSTEIVLRCSKP